MPSDIGLIGLAVMGQNLVLNMLDNNFKVSVFNRTYSKTEIFLQENSHYSNLSGFDNLKSFVSSLERPRKIMLMVQAGSAVDSMIHELLPFLEEGDIIIDGGNSDYRDTQRRYEELSPKNIYFIGSGVSGGEEGARKGPSLMPGGDERGWPFIEPIFKAIAAKTPNGESCCEWMGQGGSGHYVKMVHNGIEYGDMQLISEVYSVLKRGLGLNNEEMSNIFKKWNQGDLGSYLVEITADILSFKEKGEYTLDFILDKAGQKGTGKWTAQNALDMGIPLTLITESVFSRYLSSLKDERIKASSIFEQKDILLLGQKEEWVSHLEKALLSAKIISYAQGFMMLRKASCEYKWNLDFGAIAMVWREGCIIRSQFLTPIKEAFNKNPSLENLILDTYFSDTLKASLNSWRQVISSVSLIGLSIPTLMAGLSFFEGYRCSNSSANLIQAQRDYFGAHTYERTDEKEGLFFHTEWIGK